MSAVIDVLPHLSAGHEESYNPSIEYIPTQEEITSYQLMYEEDRPKFIPRRYKVLFLLLTVPWLLLILMCILAGLNLFEAFRHMTMFSRKALIAV